MRFSPTEFTENRRRPFLDRVNDAARRRLLSMGTLQEFKRKDMLMRSGEPGEFVMVLLQGYVKVTDQDRSGATVILDMGVPGDLHGEIAVISGGCRMANVIALETVRARRIARGEFLRFLDEYPGATKEVLVSVSRRFVLAQQQRTQSWKPQAVTRVATRLDYLIDVCGVRTPLGWQVGVRLSKDELAQFIPMGRTMVSQALDTLRRRGVITDTRLTMTVIDREQLRTLSEQ